jgi:hypothetical protein
MQNRKKKSYLGSMCSLLLKGVHLSAAVFQSICECECHFQ